MVVGPETEPQGGLHHGIPEAFAAVARVHLEPGQGIHPGLHGEQGVLASDFQAHGIVKHRGGAVSQQGREFSAIQQKAHGGAVHQAAESEVLELPAHAEGERNTGASEIDVGHEQPQGWGLWADRIGPVPPECQVHRQAGQEVLGLYPEVGGDGNVAGGIGYRIGHHAEPQPPVQGPGQENGPQNAHTKPPLERFKRLRGPVQGPAANLWPGKADQWGSASLSICSRVRGSQDSSSICQALVTPMGSMGSHWAVCGSSQPLTHCM